MVTSNDSGHECQRERHEMRAIHQLVDRDETTKWQRQCVNLLDSFTDPVVTDRNARIRLMRALPA